jgi:hypothetical protein
MSTGALGRREIANRLVEGSSGLLRGEPSSAMAAALVAPSHLPARPVGADAHPASGAPKYVTMYVVVT